MFTDIIFDEFGYTDAEVVSAYFTYLKYTPTSWITHARNTLSSHGITIPSTYIAKDSRGLIQEEERKQEFALIMYRGDPKKGNPKAKSFRVNTDGIIRLIQAAKILGYTADVADSLARHLGLAVADINKEIEHIAAPRRIIKKPSQLSLLADVCLASALEVTPVDAVANSHLFTESSEVEEDNPEEDNDLLLIDIDAVESNVNWAIYVWKKEDVVLSSSFAKFCGIPTGHINRQLKRSAGRGDLVEGVDFFALDAVKAGAFCEMNDVHLTSGEIRNGLFVLTQVGINNLTKYLKNEKAKAHSDVVSLSAAVVQDITRKGADSGWLSDPNKIAGVLTSFLDTHTKLVTTHAALLDQYNVLVAESSEREERILSAYEASVKANDQIFAKLADLSVTQERTGLAKLLPWSDVLGQIKGEVKSLVDQNLADRILVGETSCPKHLISKTELRATVIPAVSSEVTYTFLKSCLHPTASWNRITKGSRDDNDLVTIDSFLRADIFQRQATFFKEVTFVKHLPSWLSFSIRGVTFRVSIEEDPIVRAELAAFMRLLNKYQPKYSFDFSTLRLYECQPVAVEGGL